MQPLSLRWIIGIAVLIITAGTLLVAANQSAYLKSQALIPAGEDAPEAAAPLDPYTLIESYCVTTPDAAACLEEARCDAAAERCLNACQPDNEECLHACNAAWDFCGAVD